MDLFDDQMKGLRATLLAVGKGRRPSLPELRMDNKLLYQLHILRQETNCSGKEVEKWFARLFPESSYPADRFCRHLDRVALKVDSIACPEEKAAFLALMVDLDFISDALDKQGVNRHMNFSNFIKCALTNEIVADLHTFTNKEKLSQKFFISALNAISSVPIACSKSSFSRLMQKFDKTYKTLQTKKDKTALQSWLKDSFVQPQPTVPVLDTVSQAPQPAHDENAGSTKNMVLVTVGNPTQPAEKEKQGSTHGLKILQQKIKEADANIEAKDLKLNTVTAMYKAEAEQHKHLQTSYAALEKRHNDLTNYMMNLKKENEILKKQIKDCKRSKVYKSNCSLKRRNVEMSRMLQLQKSKEQARVVAEQSLKQEKVKLQKQISKLKKSYEKVNLEKAALDKDAIERICKDSENIPQLRDKTNNSFSSDLRMAVWALQEAGVPDSKCSRVIQEVSKYLFHLTVTDVPCASTVSNMADEAHYLSKAQVAEKIASSTDVTMHLDGTSRDKKKYVGHQVTLDSGLLLNLGFCEVATEDSDTLLQVTISLLEELSEIYADVTSAEKDEIFRQLLKKVTSLMSDRAAVMHSFDKKFDSYRCSALQSDDHAHFLFCNAHFLLGLSSACESGLKLAEEEFTSSGTMLGRDAHPQFKTWSAANEVATARLVRTASDVLGPRGDEKNGCRAEWLAFCREKEIQSEMTSYRANRFNSLFQNASAIFHHRDDILQFLSEFSSTSNRKLQSVIADIADDNLLVFLASLSLLHTYLSQPYWDLVNSSVLYVDFTVYVKLMVKNLNEWLTTPSILCGERCQGVFDGKFMGSVNVSLLQFVSSNTSAVEKCLKRILPKVLEVTTRQLSDFLEGGVFGDGVSDEGKSALQHCPLTNLSGEHAFGDLDFNIATRRHSTLHRRSTYNMGKRNKAVAWLDAKATNERQCLINLSKRKAKSLRKKHQQQEALVRLAIQAKIAENCRQKKEKEMKAAAEKQKVIEDVIAAGGPCKTKKDVHRLLKANKNATQALKDQLRYYKIVSGAKLKITGNKTSLQERLEMYLEQGVCHDSSQPPAKRRKVDPATSDVILTSESEISDSDASGSESDLETTEVGPYQFQRQGEWVAVFYDDQFYIGQIIDIDSESQATIKFLTRTKGRRDYFKWPLADDIACISANFVFRWDFEVLPVSSDGRVWSVPGVNNIEKAYDRIKCQ